MATDKDPPILDYCNPEADVVRSFQREYFEGVIGGYGAIAASYIWGTPMLVMIGFVIVLIAAIYGLFLNDRRPQCLGILTALGSATLAILSWVFIL